MTGIEPHHHVADKRHDECPVHVGTISYQSHKHGAYGTATGDIIRKEEARFV